jgi:large conductance mechanosensitive channel
LEVGGFRKFLLRGNLVDVAVGIVIGIAFSAVVTSFVKDLITPLIAALGGKPDFGQLTFTVNHSRFLYGDFINALISFAIVAAVLYFLIVSPQARLSARFQPPAPEPETKECPYCMSSIPAAARRCAFCTADLAGTVA